LAKFLILLRKVTKINKSSEWSSIRKTQVRLEYLSIEVKKYVNLKDETQHSPQISKWMMEKTIIHLHSNCLGKEDLRCHPCWHGSL